MLLHVVQGHRMMWLGVDMCSVLRQHKTMYHSQESIETKLHVIKLFLWVFSFYFVNIPLNCNK